MRKTALSMIVGAVLSTGGAHAAISLASIDSFDSTNEGWRIGSMGTQPSQNPGASYPGHTGFLSHFSDGSASNSVWLMVNGGPDWTGDYTAAGVTGIRFWVNASSSDQATLDLRIGFNGPGGFYISGSQALTVADGWTEMIFPLVSANFTQVNGAGTFATTLAGVTNFQLVEKTDTSYSFATSLGGFVRGDSSVTVLQFDDIAAVPEPSACLLSILGAAVAFLRRR